MRVPVPIVIILCLVACAVAWIVSTHRKNFITPPTPEELTEITNEWEQQRPNIPPPKTVGSNRPGDDDDATTPQSTPTPTRLEPEKLSAGNLDHSPALSEYGALGDKGGDAMVRLASHLETEGQFQRALLAWERVIDTANPTDEQRELAVTAVRRLKTSLPPWNTDPANDIPLTLHAGATLKEKKVLQDALTTAAELISEASGNVLAANTMASIGKSRGTITPRIPVAIWFSRPGKTPDDARAETPPISFMTNPSQQDMIARQVSAGVYSLLRTHIAAETEFSPLPEFPDGANPDDLLKYHVTRLMWREFVNSLKE